MYKNLKDITLNVPFITRDVDITNYRTNLAKIELYLNTLRKNMDLIIEYLLEYDGTGAGGLFIEMIHISEDPPPRTNMLWVDISNE